MGAGKLLRIRMGMSNMPSFPHVKGRAEGSTMLNSPLGLGYPARVLKIDD